MYIKRKEKKTIKIFSSKFFLFVLILVLAGVSKITFEKVTEWNQVREILTLEEEKIKEKAEKNQMLEETSENLKNEEYLAKTVKEKLNLVDIGEKIIYVLPLPKKENNVEENNSEAKLENKSFWQKLKEIFSEEEE